MSEVGKVDNAGPVFRVQLPEGRGWDCVHADAMRTESGVLIFSDGDVFSSQPPVAAYGIGAWWWAGRGTCLSDFTGGGE